MRSVKCRHWRLVFRDNKGRRRYRRVSQATCWLRFVQLETQLGVYVGSRRGKVRESEPWATDNGFAVTYTFPGGVSYYSMRKLLDSAKLRIAGMAKQIQTHEPEIQPT